MSNPYEAPKFDPYGYDVGGRGKPSNLVPSALVPQVRIFGILNAVQGGLECMMGLMLLVGAVVMPMMMNKPEFQQQPEPPPPAFFWGIAAYYGIVGGLSLIAGICRIVSGIRNWRFRGRTLAMASLIIGAASVFSCYCAPTSIAMLIYGMIVLLSPQVVQAFSMARDGIPPEKILFEFSPYGPNRHDSM